MKKLVPTLALALAFALGAASSAEAAIIIKDPTTTDLNTLANWTTTDGQATPDPTAIGTSDQLRFNAWSAASGTLTMDLSANLTVGDITVDSGTGNGGSATGSFVINSANNSTLTLNSGGNASYTTSGIILNSSAGGTLTINCNIALGANPVRFTASRALTINGNISLGANTLEFNTAGSTTTLAGVISGTGALNKAGGTGALTLSNSANSFGGQVTLVGGTTTVAKLATIGNNSSLGTGNGASSIIMNGATLTYNGAGGDTTDRAIDMRAGTAINNNSATGTISFTAANVIQGGTASLRNLTLGGTNTGANTLGSIYGDSGVNQNTLTKSNAGTWVLTAVNTYTGSTIINQGILRITGTGALGGKTGSTADANNICFTSTNSNGAIEFETVANLGAADQIRFRNTGGTVGSGGALVYVGTTAETLSKTIQCDTSIGIRIESNSVGGKLTLNGAFSQSNRGLYLGGTGTGDNTLAMGFAGSGAITKRDAGKWILSGTNTHTGGTTINAGTLSLGSSGALGSSGTISMNGGTLQFSGSNTTDYSDRLTLVTGKAATFDTNGNDVTLATALGGGAINAAVTKIGSGILILSGANTFTGNVAVNAGILKFGVNGTGGATNTTGPLGYYNAAATKCVVASGATLDINGYRDTDYGITIAGTGTSGQGALINNGAATGSGNVQTPNITLSADASLGGTGNFYMIAPAHGANTLDLAGFTLTKVGTNTFFFDNTTINAGAIRISGGTLSQNNTASNGSAAAFTLDNTSGVTLDLNSLALSVGSLSGGGATGGNVTMSGALTVGALNTSTTYSGVMSGAGALTKTGTGKLTLSATNGYAGGTTINAGTLALGHATDTLADGGTINVNGGTLDIAGNDDTVGAVTLTIGSIIGSGGTLTGTSYAVQAGTVSAKLGGSGALTKSTGGTVMLSSANTFAGGIDLQNGTLAVTGASGAVASQALTLGNGLNSGVLVLGDSSNAKSLAFSSLNTSGTGTANAIVGGGNTSYSALTVNNVVTTDTFAGVIGGAGTNENRINFVKDGDGTLKLSGKNTYTGTTSIVAGVLEVTSTGELGNTAVTMSGAANKLINNGTIGGLVTANVGTVKGSGTFNGGLILASGTTLAPGNSPGIMTISSGTLTLSEDSIFEVELDGASAGNGAGFYDQVLFDVGAQLSLNNATLDIKLSYAPSLNQIFTIMSGFTLASGSQSNLFLGQPDLNTFDVVSSYDSNTYKMKIDYSATAITLTVIPEPGTAGIVATFIAAAILRRRRFG